MIRLVFRRLGLHSELDDGDCFVPGDQKLRVARDAGDYQSKVEDGPWPAFPADLTSIAVALATQSEGSVLIFEKMFENRLFFVDKLISMGAEITICDPHRAIVIGPRRLRGARVSSPGHPRRHGDADRRRLRRRARARSTTCATSTAATSGSTSACAALGARIERVAGVIHPIPSGTRDVLPGRAARAARDHRGDARRVRRRAATARSRRRRSSTRTVLTRGDPAAADPAYRLFDEHGNVLVLRSDMTIPIARVVATRYATRPSRRCASVTSRTPTGPCASSAGSRARSCRRGSSSSARPGRRARRRRSPCCARRSTPPGWRTTASGSATRRCSRALLERAGVPDDARPQILHELVTRDFVGLEREARARSARAELLDAAAARGGVEVLDGVPGGRAAARAATRCWRRRRRRARDLRPRARCARSATTRAPCSRSTTPRFGAPMGGGGRYDDLLGRFGRDLPACGWALDVERAARARGVRGGRDERAAHRRAARRADRRDARPARRARRSTPPRCAPTTASCCSRTPGSSRCGRPTCPTYVEAGAADLGITGKDVLAEQSERDGLRAARPRLRRRAGWCSRPSTGEDPAAEALRRLGVMRIATKYPRIAADYFERTGRQAEIVEVKGSVELAPLTGLVARDRRPHRDRHDAARERARRARGDRARRPRG